MQSGESRGAEHTFLAWTGDGAAPATKRYVDTLDFARAAPIADLVCLHDACDRPKDKTYDRQKPDRLLRVLSVVMFV